MSILSDDGSGGLEHNPIIKALVGRNETKPVVVCGYAGVAERRNDAGALVADATKLRIYASLEDLTAWHDIEKSAIIERVTPKNPLLPSTFFLKADATASYEYPVNAEAQARFVGGSLLEQHFTPCHVEGTGTTTSGAGGLQPYKLTGLCHQVVVPHTTNPFRCIIGPKLTGLC